MDYWKFLLSGGLASLLLGSILIMMVLHRFLPFLISRKKISKNTLPLQGKWLMAGRVNGDQERRRDTNRPRKTMKILVEGYFQWIAYNTESFSFHGTGGGSYTGSDGTYTETIDYFSRDNNKAGISLEFEYAKKGMDWHHKGSSSKGDPLHEIWTFRTP